MIEISSSEDLRNVWKKTWKTNTERLINVWNEEIRKAVE